MRNHENRISAIEDIEFSINEVKVLDPELMDNFETRHLINMGAEIGYEVTLSHGTPNRPHWSSGTCEKDVFMSYHNGGKDGHTSVGESGVGVPRNALVIAQAVNEAAGYEVFDPQMRAIAFYAAEAHDSVQNCGRTLLPEGRNSGCGDEKISAENASIRYLANGGNEKNAEKIFSAVMATAFDPTKYKQNVSYEEEQSHDNILLQELVAAADLLGVSMSHGPLNSVRNTVESMCLNQKNRIFQARLKELGVKSMSIKDTETALVVIDRDETLRSEFMKNFAAQSKFISSFFTYSDSYIKEACGQGIDDLFPGRLVNAKIINSLYESIFAREQTPLDIYHDTKLIAANPKSKI